MQATHWQSHPCHTCDRCFFPIYWAFSSAQLSLGNPSGSNHPPVGQLSTHNSPWSPGPSATVNTTSEIPWRSSGFSLLRAQVQLLVWELRSHELCKDTVPHRDDGGNERSLHHTSWSFTHFHIVAFYDFPWETIPVSLTVYLGFWKSLFASCLPPPHPPAICLLRNAFYLHLFIPEETLLTRHLFSMWFPERDAHKQEDCKIAEDKLGCWDKHVVQFWYPEPIFKSSGKNKFCFSS